MLKFSKTLIFILVSTCLTAVFYIMLILFFSWNQLNIQLNVLTPFSLLITIGLAIYVTRILNISNEKTRIEKNLIIEYLKNFKKDLFKSIRSINDTAEIEYYTVSSKLKILRTEINLILKFTEKYKFSNNIDRFDKIDTRIRDIKDLFTDEADVINNKIVLKAEQKDKANGLINEIELQIFELIIEINRK